MKKNKPNALKNKVDIQKNPDPKIDQDFPGYPYGHSSENIINPSSGSEKKIADINNQDGEKQPGKANHQ
jgi:hypothetical protein